MTEVAGGIPEQFHRRGVVQVDGEPVRKHEFHPTEGIPRPGILPQLEDKPPIVHLVPVDGRGVDFRSVVSPAGKDPDPLFCQVPGVGPHFGKDLLHGDLVGDVPVGIELQVFHRFAEDRCRRVALPRDDPHRHHDPGLLDDPQVEIGDVHQDVAPAEIAGDPAPSLQVQFDLANPVFDGDRKRRKRVRADDPVGFQSVSSLEAADRVLQCIVEHGLSARIGNIQITGNRKACPQQSDPFAPVPFPQAVSGGNDRPTPLLCQVPVPHQGLFQSGVSRMGRAKLFQGGFNGIRVERRLQEGRKVRFRVVCDPVRMKGFGIHAARQQMRGVEKKGVGQEQIEVRCRIRIDRFSPAPLLSDLGDHRFDEGQMVVVGRQPFPARIPDGCDEGVRLGETSVVPRPRGRILPFRVEHGDHGRAAQYFASTRKLRRRHARIDLSPQEIHGRLEKRFSRGPLRGAAREDPGGNEDAEEIVPHDVLRSVPR